MLCNWLLTFYLYLLYMGDMIIQKQKYNLNFFMVLLFIVACFCIFLQKSVQREYSNVLSKVSFNKIYALLHRFTNQLCMP
jgi:hypothetical protein